MNGWLMFVYDDVMNVDDPLRRRGVGRVEAWRRGGLWRDDFLVYPFFWILGHAGRMRLGSFYSRSD